MICPYQFRGDSQYYHYCSREIVTIKEKQVDKGASNSQGPNSSSGPSKGVKDEQWKLLKESQVDTWKLQGLA
jgi:hypothetical protein